MSRHGRAQKTAARGRAGSPTASSAAVQLFCLPYAGASASVYCKWQSRLPSWIEVCPVELPGHGRDIAAAPLASVAAMVERVLPGVQRAVRGPFALFGHSMGALLAFELAYRLEADARDGDTTGAVGPSRAPLCVFASGTDAPSLRSAQRYRQLESDAEIFAELQRLSGTPAAVLADAELMELALPILRADFAACAAYGADRRHAVHCPIEVFGGALDTTTPEGLGGWRDHTRADFSLRMFPGGHFFIHEEVEHLLLHIAERLEGLSTVDARARVMGAPLGGDRSGVGRQGSSLDGSGAGGTAHG
jgi:surfactin synthase thioesterase subunit